MSNSQTVFVVDDDAGAAASLEALMYSIGLNVETYSSAEQFMAAFDVDLRGCLVLDVRLGGLDGLELQKKLKAAGSKLPVIVISGHADDDLSEKALGHGAVACFEKPFHADELCSTVRSLLSCEELV